MTILFLCAMVAALWLNLIGVGLIAHRWVRDYAVARLVGVLGLCLGLFFLEHFWGMGKRLPFLPISTLVSAWLVWRERGLLRQNWWVEMMFAVGFFYCLVWRCAFPDIDLAAERVPDLVFIQNYMIGDRLPALDRWLPPFSMSFYYGYQHYSAGLMGRWLWITPEFCYQIAFCAIAGLTTCAAGVAAVRFQIGRTRRLACWLVLAAFLVGGNGVIVALHVLFEKPAALWQSSRFLGMEWGEEMWGPVGRLVAPAINPAPFARAVELPVDTFSYALFLGEYHAPLTGFALLAFAVLLLATQEAGATGRQRKINHALLAATVPMMLIGNVWIAPLQILLVAGWLIYRSCCGEKGHWQAAIVGGLLALGLCYPHLVEFTVQPIAAHSSIRPTLADERTPFFQWILMFWPVLGILIFSIWNRERPAFTLFLVLMWVGFLGFAEFIFADDGFGGAWNRYNTTLKWWSWIYAGITLTLGAHNMASRNRVCRWGTGLMLLLMCSYAWDLGRYFFRENKPSLMKLDGSFWLTGDTSLVDLIASLRSRPDGIAIESGHIDGNSETTLVAIFSHKMSLLGWVVHQKVIWRGDIPEIERRRQQIAAFYQDALPDPIAWLAQNDVRYIIWLKRDNVAGGEKHAALREKIKTRYRWEDFSDSEKEGPVGYWERKDDAP